MSENGLSSSTILDCSVAFNDVEDNMMDSVKVGLKYGEACYTLSDGCNTTWLMPLSSSSGVLSCLSLICHSKTEHAKSDLRRDI